MYESYASNLCLIVDTEININVKQYTEYDIVWCLGFHFVMCPTSVYIISSIYI